MECNPLLKLHVFSTARTCKPIVLDCLKPISHMTLIQHKLDCFGVRLNKQPWGMFCRKETAAAFSKGHLQAVLSHR